MRLNKKYIAFLVICLFLSGIFGMGYNNGLFLKADAGTAFAEDEKKDEKKKDENNKAKTEDIAKGETPCPECPDPAKVVLRGLEDKKNLIEKDRKELEQEKKELERYEEQIDEKLTALENLKKQIKGDLAQLEEKKTQNELEKEAAYEAKLGRLVKMYAGMKPKSAALIVDKMKLEVAQEIFLRMREASAAQIMAFVDSEKAAKISERLAFKKN
jgi:flagellar motility protein MotE (MotC chaperone)